MRARLALVGVVVVALLAGCTAPGGGADAGAVLQLDDVATLAKALPKASAAAPETPRLAKGLVPPTNKWFSGLVFGDEPQPVFPLPLSFALDDGGIRFGVPTVSAAPGAISAPFAPQLGVTTGATSHLVTRYDDASVTIAERTAGRTVAEVTIARGSPVVSVTARSSLTLGVTSALDEVDSGIWSVEADGQKFRVVGSAAKLGGDSKELTLAAGTTVSWVALPNDASADDLTAIVTAAATPVTGVTTTWARSGKQSVTTLGYHTASGAALIGVLPVQQAGLEAPASCSLGSYSTVYGEMSLCSGTELRWHVPIVEPAASIGADALGRADKKELAAQLGRDIASTADLPGDTYFGGKALARLATLLQLSRDIGDSASEAALKKKLDAALREWTDPAGCEQRKERCFTYSSGVRGIVGESASFGSDEFNDHHFHYGYFLFAAGVAAAGDSDLAKDLAPVMTLLAADIATGSSNKDFPARRVFDPYSGHSWASGYSPFRDGNNQESSSEAVAAWNGLALWAQANGDAALESEATWMLSNEAASASAYWLDFDTSQKPYADYDRSVVGIVWDGKRDYGTWFSAEPSAILGIQLLPMSPVADYLAGDPKRIRANLAEARASTVGQFGDYLLMYQSLASKADAAAALTDARALPSSAIDDGNSRSYLLAWIMIHASR